MKSFYLTDTGIVRSHNEDSIIIVENQDGNYLMAVADGMGGHSCGEVASSIAIRYVSDRFKNSFFKMGKADAVEWIKESANEINTLIFKYTEEHPESKGMGTTLVMAIITKEYILFGNIGDSSGFVVKDNKLHKVTQDHTLVNLLVKAGELTKEEALHHPKKNILMNALGVNDPVNIDVFDCNLDVEQILLSSDGLTSMLDHSQIEKVLIDDTLDTEEKVIKLIKKVNNRGGSDNTSIAYLILDEGSDTK